MALLSGEDIRRAIVDEEDPTKRIVVTPFFDVAIQLDAGAASIDLRLGSRFSVAKRRRLTHFAAYPGSEKHPGVLVDEYYVPLGGRFLVHPHQFVLATTLEWLKLPTLYGGYILGRSTFGRRGLIIATASGVHPGYSGVLTLELTNVAEIPLEITPGQSICQLFLHQMKEWQQPLVDRSQYSGSLYPRLGTPQESEVDRFLKGLGPASPSE